ncbi:MAG: hypothetical protein O7D93_13610, partial [Acidobacteria bacterium]|nr:hypothetical protein [Acidobacteriota bacterium]
MKHLDLLLSGGIPRGQMTEIIGPASSGKTSLLLSILSQATTRGEAVAYIDSFASLDPIFARKAGIELQRLLWVRGGTSFLPEKTLKAADILAGAGGFGVVVLDLETQGREVNSGAVQKIPFHCWFRLKRIVQGTPTILLILGNEATAGSAASVVISLRRRKAQWCFTTLSAHFHKYGDVCCERDGAQIEARRRVDVETSARRSNKEMGPSRRNP